MTIRAYHYAGVLAGCTWLLLIVGALVHGTGSSLACPDWPTCYGSFFPKMEGGVFFEHGHRVVATLVGVLTIGLVGVTWRARAGGARLPRDARGLAIAALGMVILQGVLGGLTVIYKLPTLVSTAHLGLSMIFFSTTVWTALRLRELQRGVAGAASRPETSADASTAAMVRHAVRAAWLLAYLQIVLGGLVRHTGAGLACITIPFCEGGVWPEGVHPTVTVQAAHRLLGLAVALAIFVLLGALFARRHTLARSTLAAAGALALLALAQVALGLVSVQSGLGLVPVTSHLAVAALILADLTFLAFATGGPRATQRPDAHAPGATNGVAHPNRAAAARQVTTRS